jgi:hypothetical protein
VIYRARRRVFSAVSLAFALTFFLLPNLFGFNHDQAIFLENLLPILRYVNVRSLRTAAERTKKT